MSRHSLQLLLDPITSEFPNEPSFYEEIGSCSFADDSVIRLVEKYIRPYFLGFSEELKKECMDALNVYRNKEFEFVNEFDLDEIFISQIHENHEQFLDILYQVMSA